MLSTLNQTTPMTSSKYIQVINFGHYTAYFTINFKFQGSYYTSSSGLLTAYPARLQIPEGASSLIFEATGYYDPSLSESICVKFFPLPVTKCYILWGTPGKWGCREIPCPSLGNPTPPSNPCCNCCCNCTCNNPCTNLY